jgi:hypothetical protein
MLAVCGHHPPPQRPTGCALRACIGLHRLVNAARPPRDLLCHCPGFVVDPQEPLEPYGCAAVPSGQ